MTLDLTSLRNSLSALERAIRAWRASEGSSSMTDEQRETLRAGVIQTFEVAYEQCWKYMRRCLADELGPAVVTGIARRELFRLAAEHGLIRDPTPWMAYHEARNLTSHTYDAQVAIHVASAAPSFAADASALLAALERRCA